MDQDPPLSDGAQLSLHRSQHEFDFWTEQRPLKNLAVKGLPSQHRRQDSGGIPALPAKDNAPGALDKLFRANDYWRKNPWPVPFSQTTHVLRVSDARDLSWITNESVHLVVTSPPYWTLKDYNPVEGQLGDVDNYEHFLDQLDKVWAECYRVLVPGGRICCVVGDVCISRKEAGRHFVMPLHSDIQVRARKLGLDSLTPIFWFKIANGVTEAQGNGAGFYGKPYQPRTTLKP
jgi:site-specific DNA-methyltransferase (adenine-specific)